jgi:hypothetical protein
MVKKKAAVCLLQLYRKYPDFVTPDVWADRLIKLLNSRYYLFSLTLSLSLQGLQLIHDHRRASQKGPGSSGQPDELAVGNRGERLIWL